MTKLIIFCRDAKNSLDGNYPGGAEKQMILIANGLRTKGFKVHIIDIFSEFEFIEYKGIIIIRPWKPNKGIRGLRFIYYQLPSLWKTMKRINVDFYYVRGESLLNAVIAIIAKLQGAKYLWGLAGDWEADYKLRKNRKKKYNVVGTISRKYLINISNMIQRKLCYVAICQNEFQFSKLQGKVKRKQIISNIFESKKIINDYKPERKYDFIWIGQISGIKGESEMLKIVRAFPEYKFLFLGKIHDNFKSNHILNILMLLNNTEFKGQQSNNNVMSYLSKTKVYIHSSKVEGVSNAILEAMACGAIVVSMYYDTNHVFSYHKAGYFTHGDANNTIKIIREILKNPKVRKDIAIKAANYIHVNHSEKKVMQKFEKLLSS